MILVTGASGFVGREVMALLPNSRAVIRDDSATEYLDTFKIDSLNSQTQWEGAFDNIKSVIHLAGMAHNPRVSLSETYQSVNVDGTLALAMNAVKSGVKRFVFVSSIGVNGTQTNGVPFSTNQSLCPHNAYTQSKYDAEVALLELSEKTGLELVIIRPTLVYGLNAPGNFALLKNLVERFPILPFGQANNRRNFIAVQNLADLLVECATNPSAAGQTFLAADNETVSIREFTNAIAEGLRKPVIQCPVPISLMRLLGKVTGKSTMIQQLYGDLEVDSSNLNEVLGWAPPLSLKQAMASLHSSR